MVYHLGTLKEIKSELFDLLKKIEIKYGLEEVTNSVISSKSQEVSPDIFF